MVDNLAALVAWDRAAGIDLVLVQDDSPSMCRSDCTAAIRRSISLLDRDARVGFIAFGARDRYKQIPLRWAGRHADRALLLAEMAAFTFDKGGPDYGDGLRSAVDLLSEGDHGYGYPPYNVPGRAAGFLFVSDGRLPDRHQLGELREFRGVYDCLLGRGWPVFTIGVGAAAREPAAAAVLREMAEATGGKLFLARTPDAAAAAAAAAVTELGSRQAERARLATMTRVEDRVAAAPVPMGRRCTA